MADLEKSRGQTLPVQGETQQRSLRQPHERDESAGSQVSDEPSQTRMGSMARNDLAAGRADTSKQRELQRTYEKLKDGPETAGPPGDASDTDDLKREG